MRTNRAARLALLGVLAGIGGLMAGWALTYNGGGTIFGTPPGWLVTGAFWGGLALLIVSLGFLVRELFFREKKETEPPPLTAFMGIDSKDTRVEGFRSIGFERGIHLEGMENTEITDPLIIAPDDKRERDREAKREKGEDDEG